MIEVATTAYQLPLKLSAAGTTTALIPLNLADDDLEHQITAAQRDAPPFAGSGDHDEKPLPL